MAKPNFRVDSTETEPSSSTATILARVFLRNKLSTLEERTFCLLKSAPVCHTDGYICQRNIPRCSCDSYVAPPPCSCDDYYCKRFCECVGECGPFGCSCESDYSPPCNCDGSKGGGD